MPYPRGYRLDHRDDPLLISFAPHLQRPVSVREIFRPYTGQFCKTDASRVKQQHHDGVPFRRKIVGWLHQRCDDALHPAFFDERRQSLRRFQRRDMREKIRFNDPLLAKVAKISLYRRDFPVDAPCRHFFRAAERDDPSPQIVGRHPRRVERFRPVPRTEPSEAADVVAIGFHGQFRITPFGAQVCQEFVHCRKGK